MEVASGDRYIVVVYSYSGDNKGQEIDTKVISILTVFLVCGTLFHLFI